MTYLFLTLEQAWETQNAASQFKEEKSHLESPNTSLRGTAQLLTWYVSKNLTARL